MVRRGVESKARTQPSNDFSMNRLQAELQRLYLPAGSDAGAALLGPDGRSRAMVLQLARPGSWEVLARAWQGVQAELELPAPAIAVSGIHGLQLWFSFADAVPASQAMAFGEALRRRYLGDAAARRVSIQPAPDASAPGGARHVEVLPPVEEAPGRWSAFVAPDLASLFTDETWLDLPPGPDAQADLLARVRSIAPGELRRALQQLGPMESTVPVAAPVASPPAVPQDPRSFLLATMNDGTVDLHLRIEAAKALLPYFENQRQPR